MTTTTQERPTCTAVEGCHRAARSRSARACNAHYEYHRRHGVYSPDERRTTLPARPLIRFAAARGIALRLPSSRVEEATVDRLACNVLKVHPATIYGDDWFSLS